jgi:predicted MFS family arabinose efflux permease
MNPDSLAAEASLPRAASPWTTLLLAFACGLVAANLYYAQPLAGPIGAALGLSPAATGLIVTLTQLGYGCGLLMIVPLGDLVETRRLVTTLVGLAMLALLGAALSTSPLPFFVATLCIGLASVAAQVLVPYAAHLAPAAQRGRVVGNVMSGLMTGIMLARPLSSAIAQVASWHAVFFVSAAAMAALAVLLLAALPPRRPAAALSYRALLASMGRLALTSRVLQRRALYQAAMFGAFSVFWTIAPLRLAREFQLSQGGIALFALAGVAGAIASPIAGRLADAGHTRATTAIAMLAAIAAFALSHVGAPGSAFALGALVVAGIVIDFAATTNVVLGQRAIFALGADVRSRVNGVYMATFFAGGAIGSALGGLAFAHGGWLAASALGAALPLAALAWFATE